MTKKEFTLQAIISMAANTNFGKTLKDFDKAASDIIVNAEQLAYLVEDEGLLEEEEE